MPGITEKTGTEETAADRQFSSDLLLPGHLLLHKPDLWASMMLCQQALMRLHKGQVAGLRT